jgi:photosystem II stability/assembly factor-like uncharacterized protein
MRSFVAFIIVLGSFCGSRVDAQEIWAGKDGNIKGVEARGFIAEGDISYLATPNEVYTAGTSGDKWDSVFSVPAGNNEISCIAGMGGRVFVGTKRGLYRSDDRGRTWKNVFRTIIPEKSSILNISISGGDPKVIAIGTEKGAFLTKDGASSWQDISGPLKNKGIRRVLIGKGVIYAGGDGGLYATKDLAGGWERIYVKSPATQEQAEGSDPQEEQYDDAARTVNCLALKGDVLYAGIDKGVFYSSDGGKSWAAVTSGGISGTVNDIAAPAGSDKLYCATTKGMFEYEPKDERWRELYKGMDKTLSINSITLGTEGEGALWASTDNGLYKLESGHYAGDEFLDVERNLKGLNIIFDNEPPFTELQNAAIRHADVDPEKIRKWQRESRLKALAPKVSIGWDKNIANNYEIYTSATKDYVAVGPDDISNGMDVSVSWDISGLIWSNDQTNIDVRSRLMVQLRNDILDDLRRAYYERKRLQFELIMNPPKDIKARFDKQMRVDELTQAIDDLTDNHLSRNTKKPDR